MIADKSNAGQDSPLRIEMRNTKYTYKEVGEMSDSDNILDSKSGNAACVAFDHGIDGSALPGSRNPRAAVERFIVAQPDAVLMSPPLLHVCADLFEKYPAVTPIASLGFTVQFFDFDFAVQMGAKAIKNLLILGQPGNGTFENMRSTAHLASQARKKGIPFMVEAVLWGSEIPEEKRNDPELIYKACRMALECGADLVKTTYTGDANSFKDITSSLPIPILILGGAKGDLVDKFQVVREAMDVGARGVVFGRNVFQHKSPSKVVEALKGLVHNGITAGEAIEKTK